MNKSEEFANILAEDISAGISAGKSETLLSELRGGVLKNTKFKGVDLRRSEETLAKFDGLPYTAHTLAKRIGDASIIMRHFGNDIVLAWDAIEEYNHERKVHEYDVIKLRLAIGPAPVRRNRAPKSEEATAGEASTDEATADEVKSLPINADTMFDAYAGMPADQRIKFLFAALAAEGVTPIVMDAVVDSLKAAKRDRVNSMV